MLSSSGPGFFGGESKNTEQAAQWAAAEELGHSFLENSMDSTGPPRALPYLGSTGAGAAMRTTELALSGDPGTLCWKSIASESGANESRRPVFLFDHETAKPSSVWGHSVSSMRGVVIKFGGYGTEKFTNMTSAYDPQTNTWGNLFANDVESLGLLW